MSVMLSLQMRQHLALTPRLQQSLRLLQLSSLEFQQTLQQALDQNPFLEDGDNNGDAAAGETSAMSLTSAPADAAADG